MSILICLVKENIGEHYKIKKRLKESAKIESHIDIQKQNAEESIFIQKQN